MNPRPALGGRGAGAVGTEREHRPARAVEIACQDVDDVDEPAAQRSEFDRGGADPAVDGGRRGGGEFAGQHPDLVRGDSAVRGDGVGPEVRCDGADLVDTVDMVGHRAEVDQTLVEEHVHDGEHQRRVGARAGSDVPIGEFGGAGAGGIDDDQLAAALAQRPQLAGKIGGGGQTAVGHKGIRADDDEVVRAVEVGHGERDRAAEHQTERDVLGHLVQRARAEHLTGAERTDDHRRIQRAGDRVRARVAEIHPDRRSAVLAMTAPRPSATAANASSQVASVSTPSRRTRGRANRSGSLSSSAKLAPFGQMKP